MLFRKLLRTALKYRAQFLSMIVMATIGIGIFLGFNIEWYSLEKDTADFFAATRYADFRLYNERGFSERDVSKIRAIPGVEAAGRFLNVNVQVKDSVAQVALMVSEGGEVSIPLITSGRAYDETGEGIWLSDRFAAANGLALGDTLTLTYMGRTLSGEIVGLCKSGEMMICTADSSQLMPDFHIFGFAYISPAGLKKALGLTFYPQINLISSLDKPTLETAVAAALGKTIMVAPKEDHMSYMGAQSEVQEGKTMAAVLPVLFLAIGMLTMVTTMHRIAVNEKIQIGTLKALGFRDRRILMHYTAYGLSVGLVGAALGAALGYGVAALILDSDGMMGTYFDLPEWTLYMPGFCWPLVLLAVAFMTLICFLSVKKMLRGTAADALRPYEPKAIKKLAVERLPLWEKLPFGTRWNLRDTMRHKARSVMTLIGVAGCMILMVGGLGMKDALNDYLDTLDRTSPYAVKVTLSDTAVSADAEKLARELEGDWSSSTGVSYRGNTVMLEIYDLPGGLVRFVDEDGADVPLTDDGAYLCLRLRDTARVGETIQFSPYGSEETYSVRVAGYLRSVLTENIVMTRACAEEAGIPWSVNAIYTRASVEEIPASKLISASQDKATLMDSYVSFMEIMDIFVWVLMLGAVILGVVVLYNLGVMSDLERHRELATLKVLGFRDRQIGRLLVSQNAWLTVIGMLIGLPAGVGALQILLMLLASDYELRLALGPLTYGVSIAVTFGVSLAVGWMVARRNRRIDMVEALKGAE